MGMYDTVMVPCPACYEYAELQSKSGKCNLETFSLDDAPDDVLLDLDRGPLRCRKCGTHFAIEIKGVRPRRTLSARTIVASSVETDSTTLVLDRYERDNLLALLHLINGGGPSSCLATGDWAGQIYWKLAERGFDPAVHTPNQSPAEMLEALVERLQPKPFDKKLSR